ncbi:MAG: phosphatidylglycerol lysyltransferase domain-containing protein [Candidatus Omnitrophica bacterium]|nr:phosphatidylglycerol lysyltransferase domain-containing protein [Candidatus Omnitrophota bacterium]
MYIKPYPEFTKLDKEMKAQFDASFLKLEPVISEFTFTNLYCWRESYKFYAAALNDFIILRSGEEQTAQFFPPIGIADIKPVVLRILNDTKKRFVRLPEETAAIFKEENSLKLEFDRDNSDYLYKAKDLELLKGRKYDAKRNLIKKFKSTYEHEYIKLNSSNAAECLDFEERWCVARNCDKVEGLKKEKQAIREMIGNFGYFNLIGAVIKIKKNICAIAVAEKLNSATLVMHILKANPDMRGLYQVMLNDFLLNEAQAFEYINLEQDLGVPGLRQAKSTYNPFKIIKKYTLSQA